MRPADLPEASPQCTAIPAPRPLMSWWARNPSGRLMASSALPPATPRLGMPPTRQCRLRTAVGRPAGTDHVRGRRHEAVLEAGHDAVSAGYLLLGAQMPRRVRTSLMRRPARLPSA